jgi:predicted RNase H-like nuclease
VRAVGVDVSEKRGLDLVVLDDGLRVELHRQRATIDDLVTLLNAQRPEVVAIDSPPKWGHSGGSRSAERDLRRLGIQSYGTPSDPAKQENAFYGWMRVGIATFEACAQVGYPLYTGGIPARTAMEVFPHASAVVLAGGLPPRGLPKLPWRRSVLAGRGVSLAGLDSLDLVDAGLAALTGIFALRGESATLGEVADGVIVIPARAVPAKRFGRCASPASQPAQAHLPRLAPCACGDPECRAMTDGEFAPGHDAKRKSLLWRMARDGKDAVAELRRRGWALPPDLEE